jgi:ElaB/YqjD/DUF883 family membrane-anchored ribosome-binding protein
VGATPDQLKADIERTRADLTTDVDALADKVSPARVAERRISAVRGTARSVKDKVMGTATDAASSTTSSASSAASTAGDSLSSAASSVASSVATAPHQVTTKTQGNPLAAGLIAFGAGLLFGSLLPETRAEQAAAAQLKETAEPALEAVKDSANTIKDDLTSSAQDAAQEVKQSAQEAVEATQAQAQRAKDDVVGTAQSAADTVREQTSDSAQTVRETATT